MTNHIRTETNGRVGKIIFNRPDALNAFTPELLAEVVDALAGYESDDKIGAIVFTGEGTAFSSGGDLKFLDTLRDMSAFQIRSAVYQYFGRAAKAIKLCSKPTIASVNGPAVGAGCEMSLACDFRIASDQAMFCETWIRLGTIPPLGGMFLLPRLIGLGRATDMILRGTRVKADEALRIGLVNEVVDHAELASATMKLANELADGPPLAYAVAKEGLRRGMESSLNAEWEFNVYAQSMLLDSADHAESLAARKDKRPPRFTGS